MSEKIGKPKKKRIVRPPQIPRTLTGRRRKFFELLGQGMTQGKAAKLAGYSPKNPDQSGYQVIKQMRRTRTMSEALEAMGFTNESAIQKYLEPGLNAHETKVFPYMKTVTRTSGNGKDKVVTEENKQILTKVNMIAWSPRLTALDMLFKLKGSYAPKTLEEAQVNINTGVKVIIIDTPRPPKSLPVIPAIGSNGDKPTDD